MQIFALLLLAYLAAPPAEAAELRIAGGTKYKPHSLVRLRAEGAEPKAALLWRVHPSKDVQRASSPRGVLEFVAHPGTFEVELLSIATAPDGALSVQEARVTVTIESCTPVPPLPLPPQPAPPGTQPPQPPPGGGGKLDPPAALGRIRFGSAGCTATVIGPRRPDGRWDVLTAAHCVSGVGARGEMSLKDGRKLRIRVVTHHRGPDCAWCVTEDPVEDLPYANLAEKDPEPGTKIWHAGYGVDKPGNREDGEIMDRVNGQGQLRMRLSVSSGDSGGGILRTDTNEVISTVCCTSGMARAVSMWGAATEVIRRARPRPTRDVIQDEDLDGWRPVPIPERIEKPTPVPAPQPVPVPATACGGM
ncbi:MAG: trypsin-like peptidase domain-containing protein [Gemmataceae bacterium]